eukprot:4245752-Alexandrium_andersonii.AAC.1
MPPSRGATGLMRSGSRAARRSPPTTARTTSRIRASGPGGRGSTTCCPTGRHGTHLKVPRRPLGASAPS